MPWVCANCRLPQLQDIGDCRGCGHTEAEHVSQRELDESAQGIERPKAMTFDTPGRPRTVSDGGGAEFKSADVNPDGSIANETPVPEPPKKTRRERVSLERWKIKLLGQVRLSVQIVGMLMVLLAVYNLFLVGPDSGIWFGYRSLFDQTTVVGDGMNASVIHVADVGLMAAGAALVWWA